VISVAEIWQGIEEIAGYLKRDEFPPIFEKFFVRRPWEDLILLNYTDAVTYEFSGDDWTPAMRVCRGIVLTRSDCRVISFPFHKFFNLNEATETRAQNVAQWSIRAVTEKLDGVMLQIFRWKGELVWASRHGIWSNASVDAYKVGANAIEKVFPKKGNWTLICEFIHPAHRRAGMVNYGDLVVIGLLYLRNLETLELIPAVEKFDNDLPNPLILPQQYPVTTFWEAYELVKSAQTRQWEGVVLQGSGELGNWLVKIKNPLYLDVLALLKSANRILSVYERSGMDGVNDLLLTCREILDDVPEIKNLKLELERTEREFLDYCLRLRERDINEIEPTMRWVKTYEVGSEKWNRTLWQRVVKIVREKRRDKDAFKRP